MIYVDKNLITISTFLYRTLNTDWGGSINKYIYNPKEKININQGIWLCFEQKILNYFKIKKP